ncbi:DUF4931 domain-containing protein [Peribacillus cavernae]|uniref:DUF4931 domain-containing protein n=1 Tax=Peribacillus cavernae TaxID=1674310 RepID=A0A3S0W213_9BACI|nr:DUF4931 domain-containing protein [Peribacillus cavernae]MDQ0218806.1 galactose-1-phosphate uridylyltransferase [Peribacillus cavernae]RUQ31015.1 DUF4931 domain-containing protein [Peribacillus cavernae]
MDITRQLYFVSQLGKQKPRTISNREIACPFCATEGLENIIAQAGPIILLENKYKTLQDTFQTVLIETDECDSELSMYSKDHLYTLFSFGIEHWMKLERSGNYRSVLFFKNHGPMSGGTIRHPHMQIVGLENVDYKQNVKEENFEGLIIHKDEEVKFNISSHPIKGFYEFNVMIRDLININKMADCIQMAVKYLLNHFQFKCESYNLFFYHLDSFIACKIMPRFVTSPYFAGYTIPQVTNDIEMVSEEVKQLYLSN